MDELIDFVIEIDKWFSDNNYFQIYFSTKFP